MTRRIAVVHKERCNPQGCGGYLCIRVCPENRMGKECIVIDTDKKIKINENECGAGVQISANRCPFHAIDIINLPEQLTSQPVHRYGENGFILYSLPTPIFGKVLGIIGRNGTGKSTAMKILSGIMKPNLGKEKEATIAELLEYYKGKEAQVFFEKLKQGKIKTAYKLQHVDEIARMEVNVKELLTKLDEQGKLTEIARTLDITQILDRKTNELSGGELQRVAIAATALKKANVYIFDEPTSYLDIKQRIKTAQFIKTLANEETAVIVIEHDLIMMDFLADLTQIMYGKEKCYGITSIPMAAKRGMNTFLEGYIKEENMRFRDNQIKFEAKPPLESHKKNILVNWEDIELQIGHFNLKSEKGEIYRDEAIGILGENATGKTTFIKILAGLTKPDKGQATKTTIAYKPQYIQITEDKLVMDVLRKADRNTLVEPLELHDLMQSKLSMLSGGELQRVAIAQCLSQDAELYLLDEPSAHLDVEQRIKLAKIIRNLCERKEMSIVIVDHDLLFMDYLSERIMIFKGIPAQQGISEGPYGQEKGMNTFLKILNITVRRDQETQRPRINKPDSVIDREQKETGRYYY